MNVDDLIQADATNGLDQDILDALRAFGFVDASYSLYQRQPGNHFVGVISATHNDGSVMTWIGSGANPDDAMASAIDGLAKWMLNQHIPTHSQTP